MVIELTEKAAKEILTLIEEQRKQNVLGETVYLRMGVKGGGCNGFNYMLDLTEIKTEYDEECESHGVKLLCDPKSSLYLDGVTVDYRDDLLNRGFVFNNPNATGTCGCGNSFSV